MHHTFSWFAKQHELFASLTILQLEVFLMPLFWMDMMYRRNSFVSAYFLDPNSNYNHFLCQITTYSHWTIEISNLALTNVFRAVAKIMLPENHRDPGCWGREDVLPGYWLGIANFIITLSWCSIAPLHISCSLLKHELLCWKFWNL
jgi:hypothetical protein